MEMTTFAGTEFNDPARAAPGPAPVHWLLWMSICAGFTAIVIRYTMLYGKLVVHPFYDDVSYFFDALLKFQALYADGLPGVYRAIVREPPHSIFSTLLALGSYVVFGARDWAPYAGDGLIVLAMAGIVNWMARGLALWQRVALFVFVLTIPISAKAVYEFRPDIASALCAAAGATMLVSRPLTATSALRWGTSVPLSLRERVGVRAEGEAPLNRPHPSPLPEGEGEKTHRNGSLMAGFGHLAAAGALFGLAMLIKTPTFPLTIFVLFAALGAASVADFVLLPRRPSLDQFAVSWLVCTGVALLVPLPVYLIQFREIFHYIYDPIFGQYTDMWRTPGTRLWHLLYYFTGEGGMDMLSRHLYLLLAIIAAGLVLALILERLDVFVRLVGFLAVTAAAYALPAGMSIKQEFFGSTFDFMLMFTAIYVLVWIARDVKFKWSQAVVVLAMLAGLAVSHFPPVLYIPGGANSIARRRVVDQIYAALRTQGIDSGPRVFMTTTGFVNASVLDYLSLKQGLPAFNISEVSFSGNLNDFAVEIDKADYVIASEQGNSEAYGDFIKSGNIQDQTLALVRNSGEFEQVGAFPTLNPKRYFLFKRIPPFVGWEAIDGLGPIEGPYPDWMLPQVRWGYGPKSELAVTANRAGEYPIKAWARGAVAGLKMTVKVDGREIGSHTFVNDRDFERFAFAVSLLPGRHAVELAYSDWAKGADKPMAVLFKSMRLVPAPAATQGTR